MASPLRHCLWLLTVVSCAPAPSASQSALSGKVVSIADGDTITILTASKKQVKVRFWGIDAPERKQAYGTKARQFTSDLVLGKTVEIEKKDTDQYGRTVGVVFAKGRNVNLAILEAGMGWWYKQYAKKATEFENAERKARGKRMGLWGDKNPTAPWDYRKAGRKD